MRIYLDNAATSWPKPASVYAAVDHYQRELGAAAGRGVYAEAIESERLVTSARQRLARLINAETPERIVFAFNGTDALNLALHGLLQPGDHVVTTVAEHNSVLRPLRWLADHKQVTITYVGCNKAGIVDPAEIEQAITPRTKLIAVIHASNVTGAIQPVAEIGLLAHGRGIKFLVDAAQSVGHLPIDVRSLHADLLAAPGHKGLLGPLGTGFLYLAPGMETLVEPTRQGGTGTRSDEDRQPTSLPDRYEAGNLNVPGLVGLEAGLAEIERRGVAAIQQHEATLTSQLLTGLADIPAWEVFGPADVRERVGVVSLRLPGSDPRELAAILDTSHQIQTRAGIHCAPRMHTSLGTSPEGTLRLSVGLFTTTAEIEQTLAALAEIALELG